MSPVQIKWSSLLKLTDLEFEPDAPKVLNLSDELLQSISWLTGATMHDRKLLRCDNNGVLLTGNAWSLLNTVETEELYPTDGTPDTVIATSLNKGVLVASSTQLVKISFVRKSGLDAEDYYVPPEWLFWWPNPTYSVTATVVPASGGTASYVGITALG